MLDGVQRAKLEHPSSVRSQHGMKKTKFLYPPPFRLSHNPGIAFTGTWCAPGIREGGGAGPVAWRKRGWKFSSEARARFAAPPHRQRPPRGPRRSGKTTGGALGRRHTFTLRGADPAPRFPTAPDRECSLTMARPETGRGNGEACAQCSCLTGSRSKRRTIINPVVINLIHCRGPQCSLHCRRVLLGASGRESG